MYISLNFIVTVRSYYVEDIQKFGFVAHLGPYVGSSSGSVCDHEVYSWSAQLGRKVHRLGGVLTQWYILLNFIENLGGLLWLRKLLSVGTLSGR
jgi:hypothetical protein